MVGDIELLLDGLEIEDRTVMERAINYKSGNIIKRLYLGEKIHFNPKENTVFFFLRLSVFATGKEQMLRIYKSSELYNNRPQTDEELLKIIDKTINLKKDIYKALSDGKTISESETEERIDKILSEVE